MKNFLVLWDWLSIKKKRDFFLIAFFLIILTILEIFGIASVIPLMMVLLDTGKSVNYFNLNELSFIQNILVNENKILIVCLFFFLIFLIKNIFSVYANYRVFKYVNDIKTYISIKILDKYIHQKFSYFIKNPVENLSSSFSQETSHFAEYFLRPILIIFSELLILFSIFFMIFYFGQAKIIFYLLPLIILVSMLLKSYNKKTKNRTVKRIQLDRNVNTYTINFFLSIREILLSGQSKIIKNMEKTLAERENIHSKQSSILFVPRAIMELCIVITFCIVLIYLDYIKLAPSEFLIILSFYFAIAYRALPSINKVFTSYQQMKIGRISFKNIKEILDLSNEQIYNIEKIKKNNENFAESIKLKNISFSYKNRELLFEKINFQLKKNTVVGIEGKSGSGKTTFLNIFCCLLHEIQGNILVDDQIINDARDIRNFQNKLSFISQDTFLLNDSIKNNIIFESTEKFDDKRFIESLKFSNIFEFINDLPKKEDTIVGLNSRYISSGQKQRICLARLYYNMNEILIFDEITNALDPENERKIIDRIYNLKKYNKTIMIVSHNPEILTNCDEIFKIENKNLIRIK